MLLSDIGSGSTVELHIGAGASHMVFSTTVIERIEAASRHLGCGVKCEQVRNEEGALLGFSHVLVKARITSTIDGRIYEFILTSCVNSKSDPVLMLYSKSDPKPVNNRETFRVPCSLKATIQVGQNRKAIDAYVHDISFTGISYTYDKGAIKAEVGQIVSAMVYEDSDHSTRLKSDVVRVVPDWSERMTLIGTHFPESGDAVNKLVANAQIRELRVRHDR